MGYHGRSILCAPFILLAAAGCPRSAGPIGRALQYLERTQISAMDEALLERTTNIDYAGNWPQQFYFRGAPKVRFREVSPFVVAFIHHSLTIVNEDTVGALGLNQADADAARRMRQNAVAFLKRFESDPTAPDAGTFGFWPYDPEPDAPESALQQVALGVLQGPLLEGNRVPANVRIYPHALGLPSDADVTATTYGALLDDAILDGGAGIASPVSHIFTDWRDTGIVPLRRIPPVAGLPANTGAFLTWLAYHNPPDLTIPNDVDLVVNANVLHTLARLGESGAPGFHETVTLINAAVAQGLHRTRFDELTDYYPDSYVFHYCVSRAYHEGPVPGLEPAVEILADDVEAEALHRLSGETRWDRGDPALNTAFAVLTLLNANRDTELIEQGIHYLLETQDPVSGGWDEAVFFVAHTDGGPEVHWVSSAVTTAFALEAIGRNRGAPEIAGGARLPFPAARSAETDVPTAGTVNEVGRIRSPVW